MKKHVYKRFFLFFNVYIYDTRGVESIGDFLTTISWNQYNLGMYCFTKLIGSRVWAIERCHFQSPFATLTAQNHLLLINFTWPFLSADWANIEILNLVYYIASQATTRNRVLKEAWSTSRHIFRTGSCAFQIWTQNEPRVAPVQA